MHHRSAHAHIDVTVSTDLASCRREWLALQDRAITTVFQTYEWLEAWQAHVGQHNAVQPVIVTGRSESGRTVFILPFGLVTRHRCRVLTWLSHPHNNYGFGVFDTMFLQDGAHDFPAIWTKILAAFPKADAIALRNQPVQGGGFENPFAPLATCRSADSSFILTLSGDFEEVQASKFSSRSRRRFRQQERALDETGPWRIDDAKSDAEINRAADAMFAQKRRQLAQRGIANPFDGPFRDFFQQFALARYGINRALRCYCLEQEDKIIATNFGAVHNGTYYGLITSMTDDAHKHLSPGGMVMRHAIQRSCDDGIHSFDFSAGDADYKARWADYELPLFETLIPLSAKGRIYCAVERARIALKRRIKRSPYLWTRVKRLRARFHR